MTPARLAPSAILFDLEGTLLEAERVSALYDGVREMVAALAAAGYRMGIVAEDGPADAAFPIELFEVVVTAAQGPATAAGRLATPASGVAYVSGLPARLAKGRAAGMPIGVALWTSAGDHRAELAKLAPEWEFEKPADVTREFAKWC